jgi:hypothetical protein
MHVRRLQKPETKYSKVILSYQGTSQKFGICQSIVLSKPQSKIQPLRSLLELELIYKNISAGCSIFYRPLFRPVSRKLRKGWIFDWGLLRTMLWQIPNFCEVP